MNVTALLQDPRFRLEQRQAPPPETLRSFRSTAPENLPRTYLRFLESCDGAQGPAPFGSGSIDIWPVEDVLERQRTVADLEGFFAFASDEAGQVFVFDLRPDDGAAVGLVDPRPDRPPEVDVVSRSFSEFLLRVSQMSLGL